MNVKSFAGRNLPVKEFCYLRTLFTDSYVTIREFESAVSEGPTGVTVLMDELSRKSSRTVNAWSFLGAEEFTDQHSAPGKLLV